MDTFESDLTKDISYLLEIVGAVCRELKKYDSYRFMINFEIRKLRKRCNRRKLNYTSKSKYIYKYMKNIRDFITF